MKVSELLEKNNNFQLSRNFTRLFKSIDGENIIKLVDNKAYLIDKDIILIYSNPFEINTSGVFKFKRNNLIELDADLETNIDNYFIASFKEKLQFSIENRVEVIDFLYKNSIKINYFKICNPINEALKIYKNGSLLINENYICFSFKNEKSEFLIITRKI